jgi:adenylate kinase family enzyme
MIIGCPGSGKSTLARKINSKLNIPIFHLDQIFWRTGEPLNQEVFTNEQERIIRNNETWVIDGDFLQSKSLELRLKYADTVIIYEFSKYIIYWRLLKRLFKYLGLSRPDMPDAFKETLQKNYELAKWVWGTK